MFGDFSWIDARTSMQEKHFRAFLGKYADSGLLVIELGAGTAVPTIRHLSNRLGDTYDASVVRINPREAQIEAPHIPISLGALEGLEQINQLL